MAPDETTEAAAESMPATLGGQALRSDEGLAGDPPPALSGGDVNRRLWGVGDEVVQLVIWGCDLPKLGLGWDE